jgi:hypothetical protein
MYCWWHQYYLLLLKSIPGDSLKDMTFQSKRAWRLQEFAAHGGNVNCLALGPKKARLMATGGEDRKVS